MKRLVALVVVLAVAALSVAGCAAPQAKPTLAAPVAAPSKPLPRVTADAYVTPLHSATLSMATAGAVSQIHVAEGERVQAGAPPSPRLQPPWRRPRPTCLSCRRGRGQKRSPKPRLASPQQERDSIG